MQDWPLSLDAAALDAPNAPTLDAIAMVYQQASGVG
jgi:hypothetical protein